MLTPPTSLPTPPDLTRSGSCSAAEATRRRDKDCPAGCRFRLAAPRVLGAPRRPGSPRAPGADRRAGAVAGGPRLAGVCAGTGAGGDARAAARGPSRASRGVHRGRLRARGRDDRHRSAIETASAHLATATDRPGALLAALEDVLDAAQRHARPGSLAPPVLWQLALMASVGERHGHDWAVVADRVRHAVEWFPDQPFADRIESVRRALQSEPEQGHSIVWLSVDHASAWGPSPVPAVELFDGDWLLSGCASGTALATGYRRTWLPIQSSCRASGTVSTTTSRWTSSFRSCSHALTLGAERRRGHASGRGIRFELLLARASVLQGGTNCGSAATSCISSTASRCTSRRARWATPTSTTGPRATPSSTATLRRGRSSERPFGYETTFP